MTNKEKYISKARKHHGDKYDYSLIPDNIGCLDKAEIICPIHGKFLQPIANHAKGAGCRRCASPLKRTKEFILGEFKKIHGNKYEYPDFIYLHNKQKINIICKKHGVFQQAISEHRLGNGCNKCRKTYKKTTETFIEEAKIKHKNKYDYSLVDYKGNEILITIICPEHGPFQQTPHAHMAGYGCSKCVSNSSNKENEWLDSLKIDSLIKQARLKINGKTYIVDGFDPKTNTVYQFHGDYWHGNPKYFKSYWTNRVNKKTFGNLYSKTLDIRELFIKNGYKYIEIWESDFKSKESREFTRPILDKKSIDCRYYKEYINAQRLALGEDFDMTNYLPLLIDGQKIV